MRRTNRDLSKHHILKTQPSFAFQERSCGFFDVQQQMLDFLFFLFPCQNYPFWQKVSQGRTSRETQTNERILSLKQYEDNITWCQNKPLQLFPQQQLARVNVSHWLMNKTPWSNCIHMKYILEHRVTHMHQTQQHTHIIVSAGAATHAHAPASTHARKWETPSCSRFVNLVFSHHKFPYVKSF